MKHTSPQFIRTDKAITQALIALLKEKPFEKITVQDILEATPVTRATFYAHFRDKYDIAEQMQEHFLQLHRKVWGKARDFSPSRSQEFIRNSVNQNREVMEALLKIHTEKVDLRQAIAAELEQAYLEQAAGPGRETEARVYAQAMAEFQLSFLYDKNNDFSIEYTDRVFAQVGLRILAHSTDDKEIGALLNQKLAQNTGMQ